MSGYYSLPDPETGQGAVSFEIILEVWYDPKDGDAAAVVAMAEQEVRVVRSGDRVQEGGHAPYEVQGVWAIVPETEQERIRLGQQTLEDALERAQAAIDAEKEKE